MSSSSPYLAFHSTAAIVAGLIGVSVVVADNSDFVGASHCVSCHQTEANAWRESHHHDAMLVASDTSVLGDFGDSQVTHDGVTTRFLRRGDQFIIRTPNLSGEDQDYAVKYTFGVSPLQQYILELSPGRLQIFTVAWDSRPADQGGQRWFDLYPGQTLGAKDSLHWTGVDQNWNHMCADCHSTNVFKNYDPQTRTFATTWTDVNVGCESCHGPGQPHLEWVASRTETASSPDIQHGGFSSSLTGQKQLETCAVCHARRTVLQEGDIGSGELLNTHLPELLTEDLYYPDGQVKDEVFVFGSFLQSKMHQRGVVCTQCHEPHSLKLRATGDGVCLQCHTEQQYQTPKHHFHAANGPGAQCVDCHMPASTVMQIDDRRDHRFAIPRPDVSEIVGSPDACTQCHEEKSQAWAAASIKRWRGDSPATAATHSPALALYRARQSDIQVAPSLATIALNHAVPPITRATVASEMRRFSGPQSVAVLKRLLHDDDPLVRAGAVRGLQSAEPAQKRSLLWPLLTDRVRAVRHLVARELAFIDLQTLSAPQRLTLTNAVDQYLQATSRDSDRPEMAMVLARFYVDQGDYDTALSLYADNIDVHPLFAPLYINAADLHRALGQDNEGRAVLGRAIALLPNNADLHHALGLTLVRQKQLSAAIKALNQAAALDKNNSRYQFVYALALDAADRHDDALTAMEEAYQRDQTHRNTMRVLSQWYSRAGDTKKAAYFRQLSDAE